ncbi:hypothetical protein OF83DRAFT_486501 [Amylostereum chailletii]|nr:hypothetical protein OF83DRAFT_486501 [Amylostereum chailletii]
MNDFLSPRTTMFAAIAWLFPCCSHHRRALTLWYLSRNSHSKNSTIMVFAPMGRTARLQKRLHFADGRPERRNSVSLPSFTAP